jgi:hypothetical protein
VPRWAAGEMPNHRILLIYKDTEQWGHPESVPSPRDLHPIVALGNERGDATEVGCSELPDCETGNSIPKEWCEARRTCRAFDQHVAARGRSISPTCHRIVRVSAHGKCVSAPGGWSRDLHPAAVQHTLKFLDDLPLTDPGLLHSFGDGSV